VLIVGQVVLLREKLRWFEDRPLFGKRILVTRAREQAGELVARLQALGAEPIEFPVIQILPAQDTALLDEALSRQYDWIIFTSVNGVKAVWSRLQALKRDARAFAGARLGAIGPATAEELAARGLCADFVPTEYVAESIVAEIGDVRGQRILLPRADLARAALADGLRQKGACVDEVTAYRTATADAQDAKSREIRAMLESGQLDAITFTSSSTVRGLIHAIDLDAEIRNPRHLHCPAIPELAAPGRGIRDAQAQVSKIVIACIGPITACTARELGLPVNVVATEYTLEGLVAALAAHYAAIELTNK
jgi:uroporphyrinogen III methyltransferase/synthase